MAEKQGSTVRRGFIQIPVLLVIIATAILGGGAYTAYEVSKPSRSATESAVTTVEPDAKTIEEDTPVETGRDREEKVKGKFLEKDSLIDSLKKQVADLSQKSSQPEVETPKTSVITLPNGAVVEIDADGDVIRTIKEATQQTYTVPTPTTQNQSQTTVKTTSENANPAPTQPIAIDASVPKIWEAQFGEQIRTHIPELSTWAPKMIRLVTNEPIDIAKTKFRFRSPLGEKDLQVTFNIISKNVAREPADTCYVNCDLGGYYSTFFLDEPLTAKIPQGASVPGSYDFEFLVVDLANNYSVQWHSARDIAEFIFE